MWQTVGSVKFDSHRWFSYFIISIYIQFIRDVISASSTKNFVERPFFFHFRFFYKRFEIPRIWSHRTDIKVKLNIIHQFNCNNQWQLKPAIEHEFCTLQLVLISLYIDLTLHISHSSIEVRKIYETKCSIWVSVVCCEPECNWAQIGRQKSLLNAVFKSNLLA